MPEGEESIEQWAARVLAALSEIDRLQKKGSREIRASRQTVLEMVAARFASQFDADARLFTGKSPQWHTAVDEAVQVLEERNEITRSRGGWKLTTEGRGSAEVVLGGGILSRAGHAPTLQPQTQFNPIVAGVLTAPLRERYALVTEGDPKAPKTITEPVLIELNLLYRDGAEAAVEKVKRLWRFVGGPGEPVTIADGLMAGELSADQVQGIISADVVCLQWPKRAIFRIWPDFEAHPLIDSTSATIKALPAQRTFASLGEGIVWAVVDSGIDRAHPHFEGYQTLEDPWVCDLHRDFTNASDGDDPTLALVDDSGHGTHVAGIIAGGLERWSKRNNGGRAIATTLRYNASSEVDAIPQPRDIPDMTRLAGMAPRAKLVSLKVLGGVGNEQARVSRVIRALQYVHDTNASDQVPRIHGVNLSLGYGFAAEWFACGQSPLCVIVDRLVRSGVVVVAAAGNTGYVTLNPLLQPDVVRFSASTTINDPGNAERAITVGSTHRDEPHTYGVSYFSSRGPTGDGRAKPDLLAPGERITSAAAGEKLRAVVYAVTGKVPKTYPVDYAAYTEQTGTSMAAPHVSGAIAAFLSVKREMIGKPDDVKRIFISSATSLNREPAFQGAGLVDLLRALQSV